MSGGSSGRRLPSRSPGRPRRGPGRPPGGDAEATRGRILDAAIDLIGRQGYGATSLAQVASAAGLSPTGLAHHVGTKRELLAAVLQHRDELDAFDEEPAGPAPFGMHEQLMGLARRNAERPHLVRLFATVSAEAGDEAHPAHAWMREHYEGTLRRIADAFREGIRTGTLRAETPAEDLTREIIALMDGLQVQWLLDPGVDMPGILGAHIDRVRERWSAPRAEDLRARVPVAPVI